MTRLILSLTLLAGCADRGLERPSGPPECLELEPTCDINAEPPLMCPRGCRPACPDNNWSVMCGADGPVCYREGEGLVPLVCN